MFKKTLILLSAVAFFINNVAFADIKFWTTETQPARMAKQEDMAKAFEAKTGIAVEVIPIDEKELFFIDWNNLNCNTSFCFESFSHIFLLSHSCWLSFSCPKLDICKSNIVYKKCYSR